MADGRALCSEHPACVQGTWTCSGNVFTYTNPVGTWNYTLAPDGRTMSTGSAVSTRLGPVPASARSRDLGAASNVTADILGIDRTPSAAPQAVAPVARDKPATAAATPNGRRAGGADPEVEANATEGRKYFQLGVAAAKKGDWSAAEDDFSVAKERFRSAKMPNDAETAASNARLAERKRLHPTTRAAHANKRSKEQCEKLNSYIVNNMMRSDDNDPRKQLSRDHKKLAKECE